MSTDTATVTVVGAAMVDRTPPAALLPAVPAPVVPPSTALSSDRATPPRPPKTGTRGSSGPRRVTARTVQIGLGVVWLVDGLLQLQPSMFGNGFATQVIAPSAQGQPGWLAGLIAHAAHLMATEPVLTNLVFAGVQLLIGVGLLMRDTVTPALVLSALWALGVWSIGEGFGGLLSNTSMPLTGAPGVALLYLAVGVAVWPRRTTRTRRAGDGTAAAEGVPGERGGRIIWAAVWCGLGLLWFLPASSDAGMLSASLRGAAAGQPGWLAHMQLSVAHALAGGGTGLAVLAGLLCLAVGAAPLLLRGGAAVPFVLLGVAMALDWWVLGQAFGQLSSGMATDPNTGPLLALLALSIMPGVAFGRPRSRTGVQTPIDGLGAPDPARPALVI